MFIAALFLVVPNWKQPKYISQWVNCGIFTNGTNTKQLPEKGKQLCVSRYSTVAREMGRLKIKQVAVLDYIMTHL